MPEQTINSDLILRLTFRINQNRRTVDIESYMINQEEVERVEQTLSAIKDIWLKDQTGDVEPVKVIRP